MGNSMACGLPLMARPGGATAAGLCARGASGKARLVYCDGHVQEFERAVMAEEVMCVPYRWDAFIICESHDLRAFTALIDNCTADQYTDSFTGTCSMAPNGAAADRPGPPAIVRPPHLGARDVLQAGLTYFLLPTRIFHESVTMASCEPKGAPRRDDEHGGSDKLVIKRPPSLEWRPSLGTIKELDQSFRSQ